MNKSLLLQNAIAGGVAGTAADGLFSKEDDHNYARSAFMGSLAGLGATALHQSMPLAKKEAETAAEHVPPVQQPPATPQPVQQPVAQAAETPKPIEQPKPQPIAQAEAAPTHATPVEKPAQKPIEIKPEKQPEAATPLVQQRRQKPVRPTPKVVRNEPKPEEFVGPHDQSKLTKTINSVKQSASSVGNGILEGAKNVVATASKLKIPSIELRISGAGKQIAQAGRSVASGLARSAQALSIAAIASMDMGGGHAVVQHAYETATHAVQVQASMATSTMTKAIKDVGEAVSNYRAGDAMVNAANNTIAMDSLHNASNTVPHFSLDDFTKSNSVSDLMPDVRDLANKFVEEAKKQGINVKITNTLRGGGEQRRLFSKGRTKEQLAETRDDRMFRQALEEYEHGKITMPHGAVTNADAGDSFHNYSLAFDFVPIVDGKISYDITSKAGKARFQKLGNIGKSIGLEWGGDWKNPDYPHMQLTHGKSIHDLYNGSKNYVKPVKVEYKISNERPIPMSRQVHPLTGAYLYPGIRNAKEKFVGRSANNDLKKIFSSTNTFEARHEYFKNMSPRDIFNMSNEDAKMYNLYRREVEERKLKDSVLYKATQKLDAIKNAASNTYIADLFK